MIFTSKNSQAATCRPAIHVNTWCLDRLKRHPFLYSNHPIWDCAFVHSFQLESHLTPLTRSATGCATATDLNHHASIFWPTSGACLRITGTVAWLSEHMYSTASAVGLPGVPSSTCPRQSSPWLDQLKKMFLQVYQNFVTFLYKSYLLTQFFF